MSVSVLNIKWQRNQPDNFSGGPWLTINVSFKHKWHQRADLLVLVGWNAYFQLLRPTDFIGSKI